MEWPPGMNSSPMSWRNNGLYSQYSSIGPAASRRLEIMQERRVIKNNFVTTRRFFSIRLFRFYPGRRGSLYRFTNNLN
jgi:hypothetical protein